MGARLQSFTASFVVGIPLLGVAQDLHINTHKHTHAHARKCTQARARASAIARAHTHAHRRRKQAADGRQQATCIRADPRVHSALQKGALPRSVDSSDLVRLRDELEASLSLWIVGILVGMPLFGGLVVSLPDLLCRGLFMNAKYLRKKCLDSICITDLQLQE